MSLGHCLENRIPLRAHCYGISCILNIAAREDLALGSQHGGTDWKLAVRAISVPKRLTRGIAHSYHFWIACIHTGNGRRLRNDILMTGSFGAVKIFVGL